MLAIISGNELYSNTLITLSSLTVAAGIIWLYGPLITYQGTPILASPEKRCYAILAIYLGWILKFLMVDLDYPNIWHQKDPVIRHHINALVKRFRGAMTFIKSTTITHQGKTVRLQDLPWFIFLGPKQSGKTALLAHSQIPFILQRHFTPATPLHFKPSENCDWWLTRDGGIIDVPSQYLFGSTDEQNKKKQIHHILWKFFLALLKKQGGKKNISGVAIALPLAEIMKDDEENRLEATIAVLKKHIHEAEVALRKKLPCYLIVTKSDLIPGFNDFFAESAEDEMTQAWGITLPHTTKADEIEQHFTKRFNALIKKLNEQLLWRLHHERNPMARPPIKDFPLQMERVKGLLLDAIKFLNETTNYVSVQGVYITSALQVKAEPETSVIDGHINNHERAVQVLQGPAVKSRAYFIKQLLSDCLFPTAVQHIRLPSTRGWKQYAMYTCSITAVIAASIFLGQDFRLGLEKTRQIETTLVDYRHVLQQFHNPNDNMLKTLVLLNKLQKSAKAEEPKNAFTRVVNYYSTKSNSNAIIVYDHALQAFLMPEIRNYFADYLNTPVNKDADSIYNVLKAYIMLGDRTHFNPVFVRNILESVLPSDFAERKALLTHYDAAMTHYQPITLQEKTITETRKYLLSLRGTQLAYIILKTLDSNSKNSDVLLGDNVQTSLVFNTPKSSDGITVMFTGRNFITVFEQEIATAAQEAATGNWILGTDFHASTNPTYAAEIADELRAEYVKKYADTWETAVENIRIETPHDLQQADAMITSLTSYDSPLVKLLNIIYENTYFEPVTTASTKLQTIGQLVDKNNAAKNNLYLLLANLQGLHDYLQPVLSAEDPRQAAYQLITNRMQHQGEPDPITRLRLAAEQSPLPVKTWINQLSNDTWHFLLKNAMRYMDTSWSEHVIKPYQTQIANRYPFVNEASDEVSLKKFIHFFGKPGIITSFYNNTLAPFVDTSKPEWTWKNLDGQPLPFSTDVLHQIQQAMTIHHAFFPNGDDNLYIPFALQQQHVGKNVERIKFNINNKVIVDRRSKNSSPYVLAWPFDLEGKYSSVELTLAGKRPIESDYPGSWGWFRLVNHAYESSKSSKEIVLNFSKDQTPAQYLLSTQGKHNPFVALNLNHFNLGNQLTTIG